MIEILPESRGQLLAIRGIGKLTAGDYKYVLIPLINVMIKYDRTIRLLFYMDPHFKGWSLKAIIFHVFFGMKNRKNFEKVAGVCGPKWVDWGIKLQSFFSNSKIRTFTCDQTFEAKSWIVS